MQKRMAAAAGISAALALGAMIALIAGCGGSNGTGGPSPNVGGSQNNNNSGGTTFTPPPAQTTRIVYNHRDDQKFDVNFNPIGTATAKDVFIMNPDGTGQKQLTNDPKDDLEAAFLPDGTRIAFISRRAGTPLNGKTSLGGSEQLYLMNTDGSNVTTVTGAQENVSDIDVGPDGSMLFHSDVDYRIYVIPPGATHQTRLSNGPNRDELPRYSPDARKIVFVSSRNTPAGVSLLDESSIYVMNADGTGVTRLTNSGPYVRDTEPFWSPDGTKIVFSTNRDQPFDPTAVGTRLAPRSAFRQLYVMNADGTGATRLTNNIASDTVPCWSPDGRKIVFASNRDHKIDNGNGGFIIGFKTQIYSMNPDGTGVTRLTNNDGRDDDPRFTQR